MILSDNLKNVHSDIRGKIYMHALELEKRGEKILKLNTGNPAAFGFEMPQSIKNKLITDIDKSLGYCDIRGMEGARYAIRQYHASMGIKNITEDDIFITNGVSEAANMILQALVSHGDEILVPTPCYSLWTNFTYLSGGRIKFYKCDEAQEWEPDIKSIQRSITPKTKAIVIINPNNPTGAVYCREKLLAIIEIAREHNLVIISDEIYDRLLLDGIPHVSTASLCDDVIVVTVNGLSKSHCICGLRCGWICISGSNKQKRELIDGLVKIASVRLCSNALMQLAIPEALRDSAYTENMTNPGGRLTTQRNATLQELDKIEGISYVKNKAAFYLFPKINMKKYGFCSDRAFARTLLNEKHILIVPGSGFSAVDENHFRIVMLPKEDVLRSAIREIGDFLSKR